MTKTRITPTASASEGQDRHRRLLLIDDFAETFRDEFEDLKPYGYKTFIEIRPENALKSIRVHNPDVVLLDLHFPGDDLDISGETSGARLLGQIQSEFPRLPIVVFTDKMSDDRLALDTMNPQRYYAKEKIVQLIDTGGDWAADLAETLRQAISDIQLKEKLPEELDTEMGFVVGKSPLMRKVVETIRHSSDNAMTVLIEGETGTGKELVAKAIHRLSGRKAFTVVNCSGVHEETLEDRLFGHEKGAFTDAKDKRKGLFEAAEGGTVFLDEIQTMPESLQNKIIRVVQDKIIQRMGGSVNIPVDVRIIVATNKPAKELVKEGKLREDLYFRLSTLVITLPLLNDRMEDIPSLWPALIEKANKAAEKSVMPTLRKEVRELLERHTWRGNVRELENVISRAVVNSKGNIILSQDIVFESVPTRLEEQVSATKTNVMQSQPTFRIEGQFESQETSENFDRLNKLSVDQRWDFLIENTAGDSRRSVFIEIARNLKASQPQGKVSSKNLTEYLCGYSDEETFKKSNAKLRAMLHKLNLRSSDLNQ